MPLSLRDAVRFATKIDPSGGVDACHPWRGSRHKFGYGWFRHQGKTRTAHTVAAELFLGVKAPMILHACDNPSCVNPRHLRGGTNLDNMRDMRERKRQPVGEARIGSAKLTDAAATDIRHRIAGGERQGVLAAEYGVSQSHISRLSRGLVHEVRSI
jgi:hypothetical protein